MKRIWKKITVKKDSNVTYYPGLVMYKGNGTSKIFRFDRTTIVKEVFGVRHVRGGKERVKPYRITNRAVYFKRPPQKGNMIIVQLEYAKAPIIVFISDIRTGRKLKLKYEHVSPPEEIGIEK